MNFIATSSPGEKEAAIYLGAFWGEIDPNDFRLAMRVDAAYTQERVYNTLTHSAISVLNELEAFKKSKIDAGFMKIIDVPSDIKIDGLPIHQYHFIIAIYNLAKAHLIEKYRDIDTTRMAGDDRVKAQEAMTDHYFQQSRYAISELLGCNKIKAELI